MTMKHAMPMPKGFTWCADCQAARESLHVHGDPLEDLDRAELLAMLRALKAAVAKNGTVVR